MEGFDLSIQTMWTINGYQMLNFHEFSIDLNLLLSILLWEVVGPPLNLEFKTQIISNMKIVQKPSLANFLYNCHESMM
jgi:hypothetical protein